MTDLASPASPRSLPTRLGRFFAPALIAIAAIAAYANSLSGPLVLDDMESVAGNPTIRHLWPIGSALWAPPKTGTAGRPVLNLSFAANYALGRLDVRGYHVANLIIHILAGLTLYGIVRRTLKNRRGDPGMTLPANALAFAVALIWTLHPLQTEAVTYISQRAESLMGLFYLLTLLFFIRYAESGKRGEAACSVFFCILGMATKEVMVTAPLVVFLYDRIFVSGTFGEAWRRRRGYYVALAGTWLLPCFLMRNLGERGVGIDLKGPWWEYTLMESRVILKYLGLAVWPHPLVFDYGRTVARQTWAVTPYVAAVIALIGAAAWAVRTAGKRPARQLLGFAGAWVFLILAPTSSVVAVAGQPMAEHRMYLPLAALAALLVLGLHSLMGRRSLPVLLVLAAVLGCLTARRNTVYGNDETLFRDTVAKCPQNDRAHAYLGFALAKKPGGASEAAAEYEESIRLFPNFAEAHNNLGIVLERIPGRLNDAVAQFEEAVRLSPDMAAAHNNLGSALEKIPGRTDEAIAQLEEALRLRPNYGDAHANLAGALVAEGRIPEAIAQYEEALRLNPDAAEMRNNLGNVLSTVPGRLNDAIAQYEAAVRLMPNSAEVHNNLGHALEAAPGRLNEAVAQFEEALRLNPGFGLAHVNLGNALQAIPGRSNEAIAQYEAALQLAPDDAEAHNNLGNMLATLDGRMDEAIAQYQEALRLNPNFAVAHNNLGQALERIPGRLGEAIAEFDEALRLNPDFAQIHLNLAIALLKLPGRSGEAVTQLKEVLRLQPTNMQAKAILERIEATER